MNKREKKIFIADLILSLTASIVENLDNMPDAWDGIELRWYIADKAKDFVIEGMGSKARKKEYNNSVIVLNL